MMPKIDIPQHWIAIANKVERERKFKVELTDLGFAVKSGIPLVDGEATWNLKHKNISLMNMSISIKDEIVIQVFDNNNWHWVYTSDSFTNFINRIKPKIRQLLEENLKSLDVSSYTPQSIFQI